jgi:hypothetical protein
MRRLFIVLLVGLLGWIITSTPAQQKTAVEETKQLQPSRDANLIESSDGTLGNSQGQGIFVGRTGQPQGSRRRGLIAFDFAGAIPPRSRILSVALTMTVQLSANGDQPSPVNLYRVLRPWKEGTSVGQGGRGAEATAGDPTWIHSVYPTRRWSRPGGDYLNILSAKTEVRGAGVYTWNSTPRLVADVQAWINSPQKNFGWILIGDESKAPTAKVFHSRESSEVPTQPSLTVTFRPPPK